MPIPRRHHQAAPRPKSIPRANTCGRRAEPSGRRSPTEVKAMTAKPDPHRVLGLQPGATLNEIRSAYRRLAKLHHPDAAGERSLARFLAVQAAYELLIAGPAQARARGTVHRQPTQTDPDKARATRDAWRARRAGPTGATGTSPRPGGGTRPSSGPSVGAQGRAFERKARLGSTSYDEAASTPFEPPWEGGDWYGASMGTYWTLNPREYADPRKHGPEYEERARRAVRAEDRVDDDEGPGAP